MASDISADERRGRLVEAAAKILEHTPKRRLNVVVLNKALFYVDLLALRDLGETVTRNTYVALPNGPVIAKYPERLIRPLEKSGIAQQVADGMAKPVQLLREVEPVHLQEVEVDLAGQVGEIMSRTTSYHASVYSHENPAWRLAYDQGLGAQRGAKPINMVLAMQQLVDEDPWLTAPPDDEFARAVARVDTTEAEEW